MTKLSPEAQALLDRGREALTPSADTKAQVLRSLDASLASTGAAAGASAGTLAVGKLWLVLALVAGVGGGWLLFRDGGTQTPTQTEVVATEVVATEVVATEVEPPTAQVEAPAIAPEPIAEPEVEAPAAKTEAPAAKTEAPAPPASTKRTQPRPSAAQRARLERELMAQAQRALRAGDFDRAREQLRTHKREFASGLLSPERQAATAIVECLDPQAVNGKAVARRFLQAHPSSPLAPRVRASCHVP